MRIQVLGLNYSPELVGVATYTTGFAEAMVARGHEVQVIAGQPYYPQWQIPSAYRRRGWKQECARGVNITRCPIYVPENPNTLKRILHHLSFACSSLMPMLTRAATFRPDIILSVAPSIVAAPVALLAARLSNAKAWLHVQDFEIEAAIATGFVEEASLQARIGLMLQQALLRRFDFCSSISAPMHKKLVSLGVRRQDSFEFRNWANSGHVNALGPPSPFRTEWNITAPHVALYSGNIAQKQGIGLIIEAARLLRDRQDILFVVSGEGPQRAELIASAADLSNVRFELLQPYERLGELLGLATVHLIPQLAGAADLVLPSKLTNILASGRPVVVTANPGTSLAIEVEGCGWATPPGDAEEFARAIAHIVDDPVQSADFGMAARRRAETRWSKGAIIDGVEHELTVRIK